ncbi:tRNA 5-methoxyuridine(34)/uridine 5-oxyacetic acid(34) synthase CmoB [Marinobacter sp. LN3S78]|uniref:tRNA 5-methoxyuridine(34)/uridine 5-oxyacetic acid(34) synthase CmoB n=1 Tax=Marinobacter sp. LN3S78 TaxID=3382300 RepID=UPI00387AF29F
MTMAEFDWQATWSDMLLRLEKEGWQDWADAIRTQLYRRFVENPHGDLPRWQDALAHLPDRQDSMVYGDRSEVTVDSLVPLSSPEAELMEKGLRGLMPWRKGPFRFFGTHIDTEWRSDWKWDRVAPALSDLSGRRVLDVGCGSGYHLWRMFGAGAAEVIGIDPGLLFLCQFLAVKRYQPTAPVDLLPLRIEDLPRPLEYFDTTFSMGVLYHRRSPIDHLLELKDTLRPGGELVLETLVVEGPEGYTLMPEDRYGRMRNVWFLPSCPTLLRWMARAGLEGAEVVDVTVTTTMEQRSTDWMRFQSLEHFLDPNDHTLTIEGYPGPQRATVIARKPG